MNSYTVSNEKLQCINVEKRILKLMEEENEPRHLSIKLRSFENEDGNRIRKSDVSKLNQFTCIELGGVRSFKQLYAPPPRNFTICSAAETKLD
jgi:hypothetical protein